MKVSEYIFDYLASLGVTHVFGLSGGMSMHLFDAVSKNPKIELIQILHEQSAAVAADAYAQYTGGLGVCLVTAGPGALNAVTGCAASYIDSTPVLFVSGQCKTADINDGSLRQKGVQEIDIVSIVMDITKYAHEAQNAWQVKQCLDIAIKTMMTGRKGPAWLSIPLDIQAAEI